MNTAVIVLIPGLLSLWIASTQSLAMAFVQVYLPVLLILPDYYTLPIDSFPDPSFNQCAMLPIGIGLCWKALVKGEWKFSLPDFAVIAFLAWQVVAELYNVGFKTTPDLLFDLGTLAVFPYMAGKTLIEQSGLRPQFLRRFVWAVFLVCLLSTYEFRMGVSLIRPVLGRFFPGQNPAWVTQLRWGYGRIAGPYGHAITMAVFVGVAYVLHRWLSRAGVWERSFRWAGGLPFSKSQILTAGLLGGLFMTLSRGPWLGVVAGVVIASVGLHDNRKRALKHAFLILIMGGAVFYQAGKMYLEGVSAFEGVEEQASAAYRAILIGQYEDIVMQSPIFGWGRANWPEVPGMKSVDNNYLFVALGCGLVGLGLFIVLFCLVLWRIFASGFFSENLPPEERAFHFTLVGVLIVIGVSTGTTYIGSIMYPMVFLLLGLSEACVLNKRSEMEEEDMGTPEVPEYRLMRVVA